MPPIPKSKKVERPAQPFHDDGVLKLLVLKGTMHRIEEFQVTYKDKSRNFKVEKINILEAWKKMEAWLTTIK